MTELIYKEEAYQIVGAAMDVYNTMGNGFVEPVYQECVEIELGLRGISFEQQVPIPLDYKSRRLKQQYIPDLTCFGSIIVELKAVKSIVDEHRAQLLNYLKATGLHLGMLVNFGAYPKLEWERMVL